MKHLLLILLVCIGLVSCNSTKDSMTSNNQNELNIKSSDTVRIANDQLEYEIIIIDPGFNYWLASTARPEGYYSQEFLEARNFQYVIAYNNRVIQPLTYDTNLYEFQIDYQRNIDYGYDVNYKLYNYFIYFQLKYNQKLTSFNPRI
ncbi:MAG: hypothetical protein BM564_07955 [Bacteroidetes bacterium MedPE-SWsnd-G2]|nr:MAG: hypothetical protein BM564_07955 [Bacteroidetes bacterium MedPE-SWsnd-G2]